MMSRHSSPPTYGNTSLRDVGVTAAHMRYDPFDLLAVSYRDRFNYMATSSGHRDREPVAQCSDCRANDRKTGILL